MTDNARLPNHHARAGQTADGAAYVVVEPRRPDPRLERRAVRVPEGLGRAEDIASRWNTGEVWLLQTPDGVVLTGDDIPDLHFPAAHTGGA